MWCAAFSPDGKVIATGNHQRNVYLWDAKTTAPVGQPLQINGHTRSLVFPSATTLLTGSGDKIVRFWDVTTGRMQGRRPLDHPREVWQVAVRPDGTIVTLDGDSTVRLWAVYPDTRNNGRLGAGLPHQSPRAQFVANPTDLSSIATIDAFRTLRVWETTARPDTASTWPGRAFRMNPEGQHAIVQMPDGKLQLWKQVGDEKPTPAGKSFDPQETVQLVALSPDAKAAVTFSQGSKTLRLWDAETGTLRAHIVRDGVQSAISFSPDGKSVLCGHYQGVTVHDAGTLQPRGKPLPYAYGHVLCVAYSPDGTLFAAAGMGGLVQFWDAATGKVLDRKAEHRDQVNALAFSKDGKYLLTASDDHTARLWHVDTGKPALPPLIHGAQVTWVAISPDGKTLATNDFDGYVQFWDAATGKPIGPAVNNAGMYYFATFRDNETLLTGLPSYRRTVRVPQALTGDAERLTLWVQVMTGLQLEADGTYTPLDGPAWQQRKQSLEKLGGSPQP